MTERRQRKNVTKMTQDGATRMRRSEEEEVEETTLQMRRIHAKMTQKMTTTGMAARPRRREGDGAENAVKMTPRTPRKERRRRSREWRS